MQNNLIPTGSAADIPMGVLMKITEACLLLRGKSSPQKNDSNSGKNKDKTVAETAKVDGKGKRTVASTSGAVSMKRTCVGFHNEAILARVAVDAAAAIKNRTLSVYTEKFPKAMPPSVVSVAKPPLPTDTGISVAGAGALKEGNNPGSTFKRSGKAISDLRLLQETEETEFPDIMDVDDEDDYDGGDFSTLETIYEEDEMEVE